MNMSTQVSAGVYGSFHDANFVSPDSGIYGLGKYWSPGGSDLWLKATNDAGSNWNQVYNFSGYGYTVSIDVVRKQHTYYHIWNHWGIRSMDKSCDNGSTWNILAVGGSGDHLDFFAVDTSHFFILHSYQPGYLDKYVNGVLYTHVDSLINERPSTMFFTDTITGYIAAATTTNPNNHLILKTLTAGTNWTNVFDDSTMNIRKMYFLSDSVGFAVGDSGKIIKTVNGGTNWQYLNSGISTSLKALCFLNDSIGFAAGDSGNIIRTTDAGLTWSHDLTGTTSSFYKIFFFNDSIGYAIAPQKVYKTNLNTATGLWEIFDNNKNRLMIYPNPTKGFFTVKLPVEFKDDNNLILKICDNNGKIIMQKNVSITQGEIQYNVSEIASGIYSLVLSNKNVSFSDKIVVQ